MRRRLLLALVAGLVLVAALVGWADQRVRSAEDRDLAACAEQAEAAAVRTDQVLGAMEAYLRPVVGVRPSLWSLMEDPARRAEPLLGAALEVCLDVDVLDLHRENVRERAAYVDYLTARRAQVRAIAADGQVVARSDPALARLREEAFADRP